MRLSGRSKREAKPGQVQALASVILRVRPVNGTVTAKGVREKTITAIVYLLNVQQ